MPILRFVDNCGFRNGVTLSVPVSFPSSSLGTHTLEASLPDPFPLHIGDIGATTKRCNCRVGWSRQSKLSFEDGVPKLELGKEVQRDPLITERKCTSTRAFQRVVCAKSPRLQAGVALLTLRPFLDSCRRFASMSLYVYILGSRCNNLLLRTDGQRCEAFSSANSCVLKLQVLHGRIRQMRPTVGHSCRV